MYDWKKIIVSDDSLIRDAMEKINDSGARLVFVLSRSSKLIGSLSDGDIRRALLKSVPLSASVLDVCNRDVKRVFKSDLNQNKIEECRKIGLDFIPVINDDGYVVDIIKLDQRIIYQKRKATVFIMAGGFGSRLRPLTENCPKPMLPIKGKPIIEHIICRLKKYGFEKFIISTHYLPEKITDYLGSGERLNCTIEYVHEEEPLGTGGALGLISSENISEPLLVMNGDIFTDINFSDFMDAHIKSSAHATMAVKELSTPIAFGVVKLNGNRITEMVEKPTLKTYINMGIYILNPEILSEVENNTRIDLPTLLESQMALGRRIEGYRFTGEWTDIGNIDDYNSLQINAEESS